MGNLLDTLEHFLDKTSSACTVSKWLLISYIGVFLVEGCFFTVEVLSSALMHC